jgi:pyruvate formate lyase activating enzyme
MDLKTSLDKYNLITSIKDISEIIPKSIEIIKNSRIPYEFRTTCTPEIVEEDDIKSMGELIKGADKVFLQQFRADITLDPHFLSIKPHSKETLERFKEILLSYVNNVEIRGV